MQGHFSGEKVAPHSLRATAAAWLLPMLLTAVSASAQQTLAGLHRELEPNLPRTTASVHQPALPSSKPSALQDTALSRSAGRALFVHGDAERARVLATRAVKANPDDMEARFVLMEIANDAGDVPATLEHAVALCEGGGPSDDPRVQLAEARIRHGAGNTAAFRRVTPRLQGLLLNSRQAWPQLSEALLAAAMDGVRGLNPYALARSAGIITDWRVVGPLGRRALAGADAEGLSRNDALSQPVLQGRAVENFQFPDGTLVLPEYLAHRGTFYAAAEFGTLEPEMRRLTVQAAGTVEAYVDGAFVLKSGVGGITDATMDLAAGRHRVLLRFSSTAVPLRVQVTADALAGEWQALASESSQEATHQKSVLAGLRTVKARTVPKEPEADSPSAWLALVEDRPTCAVLAGGAKFFETSDDAVMAKALQSQLAGCAPESLAYPRELARQGKHAEAAAALRSVLLEAPLNREAHQMLLRELQLSGQDQAAQSAAADWVRIAPNAGTYRRMAAFADAEESSTTPFYLRYRRQAVMPSEEAIRKASGDRAVVLDDHVAIARRDGSVSLYVHRFELAKSAEAAAAFAQLQIPADAQMLTFRRDEPNPGDGTLASLEMEYIVHSIGDGGITEHPEVFQHVFGPAQTPVLSSRFVVITPADESDRRTVIATGESPALQSRVADGMVERMWEWKASDGEKFAVIRVVDHENGWSVPRSAERRKKIETTRPGPRLVDAMLVYPEPLSRTPE